MDCIILDWIGFGREFYGLDIIGGMTMTLYKLVIIAALLMLFLSNYYL